MKILFLGTRRPDAQGDYLELTLIHGLRSLLGSDFVEFPKKKILYGDFSESPREKLHGKGFTFCTDVLEDTFYDRNNLKVKDFDAVIHGSGFIYGDLWQVDHPNQFWTDGNDLHGNANRKINYRGETIIGTQYTERCFKRELVEEFPTVWPIGFGVPNNKLMLFNGEKKSKLFQSTAPTDACFTENSAYKFNNEEDYYRDMNESWFGLTCKKGGWDCLRHYEIMASFSLLLFKDYDKKPPLCEPIDLPTISYSTKEELDEIFSTYIVDGAPTYKYLFLLAKQNAWFLNHGTTLARAQQIVEKIKQLI
jgi:hypothetical protein